MDYLQNVDPTRAVIKEYNVMTCLDDSWPPLGQQSRSPLYSSGSASGSGEEDKPVEGGIATSTPLTVETEDAFEKALQLDSW